MRYFYLFTIAARVAILATPYFMGKSDLIFWVIWLSIFPIFLFFYEMAGGSNAAKFGRAIVNVDDSCNQKIVLSTNWDSLLYSDSLLTEFKRKY